MRVNLADKRTGRWVGRGMRGSRADGVTSIDAALGDVLRMLIFFSSAFFRAHDSIYHALGQSTIMFMQAVLTLDMVSQLSEFPNVPDQRQELRLSYSYGRAF